jgi:hypothetical protein
MHKKYLLSEVFETLETKDLIARMDFLCCDTCAHVQLTELFTEMKGKLGYVFFHNQNTNRLLMGATRLYLGFDKGDEVGKKVNIGKIIVSVFQDLGYNTEWNGDQDSKIIVDIEEQDIEDMKPVWIRNRTEMMEME